MAPTTTQFNRAQRELPNVVALWRVLQPLRSVVSFMNSGAHPDDETSTLLAALGLRDGLALSYVCATRGEGGQNAIGNERSDDLGMLRTAEMEAAASVLNMRVYWLSRGGDDTICDFGFSKSGDETLERWGYQRALSRLVDVIRTERPDILCTTFLDVPGQHGHHQAMTRLALDAFDISADSDYAGSTRRPWQVAKILLPAWSGAGNAYDDDLPPPDATLTVDASGVEHVTGWSYREIAQQSRWFHRTQEMGDWPGYDSQSLWPLHLAKARSANEEEYLLAGLPATMTELGARFDDAAWSALLADAQQACDAAIDAWPSQERVGAYAAQALALVRQAIAQCPIEASDYSLHRLERKDIQLAHVCRVAAGVRIRGALERPWLRPGDKVPLQLSANRDDLSIQPLLPPGWGHTASELIVPEGAAATVPAAGFDPSNPELPALKVALPISGGEASCALSLSTPAVVLPNYSLNLSPARKLVNSRSGVDAFDIQITGMNPPAAAAELQCPEDWTHTRTDSGFRVQANRKQTIGVCHLPVRINGHPAMSVSTFDYPHINPCARIAPAELRICTVDVGIAEGRIGYIGGGVDRVDHWLRELGIDVMDVTDQHLSAADFSPFDTLLVGVFAFKTRPRLRTLVRELREWTEYGGNLVTLYHRPWDNWSPEEVPPRRLVIGKPSLRWRVTNENAPVSYCLPDHPLLNYPNSITESDWQGWHKERGLYFAQEWNEAYEPLLSMSDPGEAPLLGALLSANIGRGRHTHCALGLHHQMEQLVPGSFRLMANLVAPIRNGTKP